MTKCLLNPTKFKTKSFNNLLKFIFEYGRIHALQKSPDLPGLATPRIKSNKWSLLRTFFMSHAYFQKSLSDHWCSRLLSTYIRKH